MLEPQCSSYPIILRSEYSFLLLVRLMKVLCGGMDVVSQSWKQSILGAFVIRMPHDDRYLQTIVKETPSIQTLNNGFLSSSNSSLSRRKTV